MPAVVFKQIKPSRFKSEVFVRRLEELANLVADKMLLDFLYTVSKWNRQPRFEKLVQVGPSSIEILVGTDDRIYKFVSLGTRDHYVPKEGIATMRFRPGYKAKTTPGKISSQVGGAFGEPIVRRGRWKVRGIKPRHFERDIAKKWRPRLHKQAQAVMAEAAQESGHAIRR